MINLPKKVNKSIGSLKKDPQQKPLKDLEAQLTKKKKN